MDSISEIENLCFDLDRFSKRQFVYLMTKAKGAFYVLKRNGYVAAYISLIINARAKNLWVYSIAVHPNEREKKYAQSLIDKTVEYAKLNQLKKVTLEVKVSNFVAIKLYEKNSFVAIAIKQNYYHDGSDAYYMRLLIE